MKASLWGPQLWKALFDSAWSCKGECTHLLPTLLLEVVPLLLPCETCRNNYAKHIPKATAKAKCEPKDGKTSFRWLYFMKKEVNLTFSPPRPNIPFGELSERYVLHGGVLNEAELADVLVLVSLSARELKRDDIFIEFCHILSQTLPIPHDSSLKVHLSKMARPIVNSSYKCSKSVRMEHGLPVPVLNHYKEMLK